jgi:serine/threonine-protein kinase
MRLRTRVWGAGRLLLLLAGLLATFLIFFLASMRVAIRAREVAVPDVRGRSVAEASAAFAAVGLAFQIDPQRRPDPAVPPDHVISQDPDPGSVLRRQRSVRLRVSEGLHAPTVPMVVGENERVARLHLAQAQIQVTAVTEIRIDAYEQDVVIGQDPPGHSQNGSVSLLVNRGAPAMTYVMPDLIGTLASRAAEILRRERFIVAFTADAPYPGLPSGIVIRQKPQAGFQIAPGDAISLEVSR